MNTRLRGLLFNRIVFNVLMMGALALAVGCGDPPKETVEMMVDSPPPVFADVTVHDPSIFKVSDGEYRIIGSFLASAKTADFIRWTLIQSDGNTGNYSSKKYYPVDNSDTNVQTMAQQREDVLRGSVDPLNFFASDIHKMPNGKFYHYYSLTASWKCSAIGVAIAESSVEGPYVTQGLFARSAEAGENKSPDGNETWAIDKHPNCIDPQVFFDKDGDKFYLTYGSWSGGIFLYELDTATGKPKTDVPMNSENGGYGKRLIANRHSGIEAPYILYSPDSNYYYLFVSYGGLAANSGYNIRIFRSRNPEGPYEDAEHDDLTSNNLFPNPTIGNQPAEFFFQNYGVKIACGYRFENVPGEIGTPTGYLSPGHNSAYYDAVTGKYFLIHHTRFVGRGESHQVRVREMFVNEDGWLMAAPLRYDGGTVRQFSSGQLSGVWKIVNHGRDNNTTAHISNWFTFENGGTITGPKSGTWALQGDGKTAYITLDDVLYKGMFYRGYDDDKRQWVFGFTALSFDGIALWGAATN